MGGRGATSGGGSGGALLGRTVAQDKAVKRLAKRTANLKNEQFRIIDADGNVVLEKKGSRHEVAATVGEKREYMEGNVSLHNHPDGGTFSPEDLSDFGFGAKEMAVSTPEGTYRLINTKYGTKDAKSGWYDMRSKMQESIPEASATALMKQARENLANSKTNKEIKAISDKWASIRKKEGNEAAGKYLQSVKDRFDALTEKSKQENQAERRRLEVKPFHDFYKANAKKYGFDYRFDKSK